MIVVSDTTPLNYLILIEVVEVLPKLFDEVYASNDGVAGTGSRTRTLGPSHDVGRVAPHYIPNT
jgi:hypothetical protein